MYNTKRLLDAWNKGRVDAADDLKIGRYPAHLIGDNSFTEACINSNSVEDLDIATRKPTRSDTFDRDTWKISAREWAYAQGVAYAVKCAIREGKI